MSEPLLTVRNHHNPACGDPPIIKEEDRDTYIGYFENQYGEQWVFTCNRTTGEAVLRGGDIGWNKPWPVVNGALIAGIALVATFAFAGRSGPILSFYYDFWPWTQIAKYGVLILCIGFALFFTYRLIGLRAAQQHMVA